MSSEALAKEDLFPLTAKVVFCRKSQLGRFPFSVGQCQTPSFQLAPMQQATATIGGGAQEFYETHGLNVNHRGFYEAPKSKF